MPRHLLGGHRGFRPGQLHQVETAALVLRSGRHAGLVVRTEHRVNMAGRTGEIDVCWFDPRNDNLLVAWEIDGHDASDGHISNNRVKLVSCDAALKVQALYSVKNDLTPKPKSRRQQIASLLSSVSAVVTDEELMAPAPHGMDAWMTRVRELVQ